MSVDVEDSGIHQDIDTPADLRLTPSGKYSKTAQIEPSAADNAHPVDEGELPMSVAQRVFHGNFGRVALLNMTQQPPTEVGGLVTYGLKVRIRVD
ncbi:hypothetical protein NSA60_19340 [Pseudomonas oleovorans]|uniref:hypothetical protein n=2 Tax=Ectopseudomonas oleovorans TaxID=301 RepID=UPI0010BEF331|nr:hypothetical protein [Pseudomonas oleovorans]MCR1828797.1 hypothetical protein [Pseudomonas oleovorans]